MSKQLVQALAAFRRKFGVQTRERRQQHLEDMKARDDIPVATLRGFQLAADVALTMSDIRAAVVRDMSAYRKPMEFGLPDETDVPPVSSPTEEETLTPPTAPSSSGGFAHALRSQLEPFLAPQPKAESAVPNLGPAGRHFAFLLDAELEQLQDDPDLLSSLGAACVSKLQKARDAFVAERYGDVTTVLKSALRNEPHNNILLFALSQFQYFMVSTGHSNALPDARDYAQKAMLFNERIPPLKLAVYRYYSIIAECAHDEARALAWIREQELLHTRVFKSADGLAAMHAMPLKIWAVAATMDISHWGQEELLALKDMVWHVVGGAALYMGMVRNKLLELSLARKEPMPIVEDIEESLAKAYGHYQKLVPALSKLPVQTSQLPWLVTVRYTNTLAANAPLPTFDQILLNIALDGEYWRDRAYPDVEVQAALADRNTRYWRLWALALTPVTDRRQENIFPAARALEESDMLPDCDNLLATLQAAEQAMMKPMWGEILPWMIRWQPDHLLAAGTGSNQPRDRFLPHSASMAMFYRRWNCAGQSAVLPSELIGRVAKEGGFASLPEVIAALEGACRLIDDPNHGLVATQKMALQAAKQHNPAKFGKMRIGEDSIGFQKVLTLLVPLAVMGGMMVLFMTSRNIGQAVGLTLAMAGLAGVALITLGKKS